MLKRLGSKDGYTLWQNTSNKKRPYQLYKGRVQDGKLIGSYGSIAGLIKAHPKFKR